MGALGWVALAILVLPAVGALFLGLAALRVPRWVVWAVGPGVVWLAFVCVVVLLIDSLAHNQAHDFTYWTWIRMGSFSVPFDLLVDRLSIYMGLVITGVGGLIVTYAVGYMEHEDDVSYARFFCFMDLFVLSMLILVLAGNFIFLIVGWAGVGLSSYLLIGFYYWRHTAVVAARKAFVMNVIGDIGMILAAFVVFVAFHGTTFSQVFAHLPSGDGPVVELAAYLFLVGAIAKSAQLPLHTWLPDAMEGPTPVSALIHAATMVTAGVYLVTRMHPIYDLAIWAHGTVALIGTLSALFAATIALVQTDIKRVLAYSTMSQIGYMFLGVGVGAYAAGMFHLLAHAFFKALLFMGAGNVIHRMDDEQDMRRFGGLWGQMRLTSIAFLVGSLALAGIFPLVGFFSKELVLGDAFSKPGSGSFPQIMWVVGAATAVLTAFYTFRMWYVAFWGSPAADRPVEHPQEASPVMLWPVLALGVLTVIGGFVQLTALHIPVAGIESFLEPVVGRLGWEGAGLELVATLVVLALSGAAIYAAFMVYGRRLWPVWSARLPGVQRLLEHKYYFDDLYDAVFVRGLDGLAAGSERFVEEPILDGLPADLGSAAQVTAGGLSLVQSGFFRTYALVFLGGAVIAGAILLLWVYG
ncbi:MAG: NADH-quinone oxidoreductase subunit L [Candidatus Dormibacteraeota bacterium]|nr:NADH-quinone oxidoreductase subunit L [Candidatus Dormibacteraeota bacterium]